MVDTYIHLNCHDACNKIDWRLKSKADLSIEAESKLTNYETLYHKVLGDIKKQGGSDRHRRAATEAKVQLNQQKTNK